MTAMLEVSGLSAGYGGRAVIQAIDLHVNAGEIVALLGANGAGKSTLARTLSGLLPALAGCVRFTGTDITRSTAAQRVKSGLLHVPEGRQVFAGLTVAQNLELGCYARTGEPAARRRARLDEVLARFPALRDRSAALAGNLSGGQQQMLAIGRALMGEPRLLVLDEPSLGLSPPLVQEVFALVGSLRSQGLAILLSEQNARMSLAVADRAYVVEGGRIALSGQASDLAGSTEVAARYLGGSVAGKTSQFEDGKRRRLLDLIAAKTG